MKYFDFTSELLKRFPIFRKYYLEEKKANEVNLLPSNIEFDFISYYDEADSSESDSILEEFSNFLKEMSESRDEDLMMLYNETLTVIANTTHLKEKMINKNIILKPVELYPNLLQDEINIKLMKKRVEVDFQGNKYIEQNKELLKQYS